MGDDKTQGGSFGGVEDLYREVILEHFKDPHNKGKLDHPNAKAEGLNPLCGDQIFITAFVEDGIVKKVQFIGQGCAISQSAASIMTDVVTGKPIETVKELVSTYKGLFGIPDPTTNTSKFTIEDLGDSAALEGVKKYPVRIKCALLAWNTLLESLDSYEKK